MYHACMAGFIYSRWFRVLYEIGPLQHAYTILFCSLSPALASFWLYLLYWIIFKDGAFHTLQNPRVVLLLYSLAVPSWGRLFYFYGPSAWAGKGMLIGDKLALEWMLDCLLYSWGVPYPQYALGNCITHAWCYDPNIWKDRQPLRCNFLLNK